MIIDDLTLTANSRYIVGCWVAVKACYIEFNPFMLSGFYGLGTAQVAFALAQFTNLFVVVLLF